MNISLSQSRDAPVAPLSSRERTVLLASAHRLQRACEAGDIQPLLRGKKLGLLCEDGDSEGAIAFRRAAMQLGAHVAHIRPSLSAFMTPQEIEVTARLLGRLYDAVECQGLTAVQVRTVAKDAGVPVYGGVALPDHPTAGLAALIAGEGSPADKRLFVLQAVLVHTIG